MSSSVNAQGTVADTRLTRCSGTPERNAAGAAHAYKRERGMSSPRRRVGQNEEIGVSDKSRPLVLVCLARRNQGLPSGLMQQLQGVGAVVYVTHGWEGCLRAATSLVPTTIYLDPRLTRRVMPYLRAHPNSAWATIAEVRVEGEPRTLARRR
jgi:hypothetical protein